MAVNKFPVSNLLNDVEVTIAPFSSEMPKDVLEPKLQRINDELQGMFEASLSPEEIDQIVKITEGEERNLSLLTNVNADNLVEFKASWSFAPDCKIDLMHSQSDDYNQKSFIDIIISREYDDSIISLHITTTLTGDKVIKRFLLRPKEGLDNLSEFAFTLKNREVVGAGFTGNVQYRAREHLNRAFPEVDIDSMTFAVDYRKEQYQYFRKQLFNLD